MSENKLTVAFTSNTAEKVNVYKLLSDNKLERCQETNLENVVRYSISESIDYSFQRNKNKMLTVDSMNQRLINESYSTSVRTATSLYAYKGWTEFSLEVSKSTITVNCWSRKISCRTKDFRGKKQAISWMEEQVSYF